jgi:hypothetical protein
VGGSRKWGKGAGGLIRCKYCVYMYVNRKMRPAETILGMVEKRINEDNEGD